MYRLLTLQNGITFVNTFVCPFIYSCLFDADLLRGMRAVTVAVVGLFQPHTLIYLI